jgi:hypothetical protein
LIFFFDLINLAELFLFKNGAELLTICVVVILDEVCMSVPIELGLQLKEDELEDELGDDEVTFKRAFF